MIGSLEWSSHWIDVRKREDCGTFAGEQHCAQDWPCTNRLKSSRVVCLPITFNVSKPHRASRQRGGTQKMRDPQVMPETHPLFLPQLPRSLGVQRMIHLVKVVLHVRGQYVGIPPAVKVCKSRSRPISIR